MPKDPNDQDDSLWEVMGQAREPRVSPFFARNVLREVRALEQSKPWGRLPRRWWKWALPLAAAVAVCIGGVVWESSPQAGAGALAGHIAPESEQVNLAELPIEEIQASPDYDVIKELDALLAYEKNDTWLDTYASN